MRMSRLIGRQVKEVPKDAQTISHVYLLRGGYIRPVSAGIYSVLPLGKRVLAKIERIVREEMERIDGQEVLMPVVIAAELWEESGRYDSVGAELLRFNDRNGKRMVLGMTHEEAVVHLARTEASSYKQLPFMLYQIQTKYRDEARPRAGLIRVREFTMKDAYSFHESQECLADYYDACHEAYERIFRRIGMPDVISIESDSGMMGGSKAHEFMAVADCGEDTLFLSPDGSYRANREVATTGLTFETAEPEPLTKVATPGQKTIAEVAAFLDKDPSQTGKAVFYADADGGLVFAVIRGDLEVNEAKLKKVVQSGVLLPATDEQIRSIGSVPGYASPMGVDPKACRIVMDPSAAKSSNLVVGANEADHHYTGFNFDRDMAAVADEIIISDIATAREGDPCPLTGEPLQMRRGIEVGNIFQLGTKYSGAMQCEFLDRNGKRRPMIMGCYGLGVGRAAAATIEQCHDEYGPIWPISIAPYEVHIVGLRSNKAEVAAACEQLEASLTEAGVEVIYDDRNKRIGFAFSDADLVGAPYRLIVSPKTLAEGQVEFRTRDGAETGHLALDEAAAVIIDKVKAARAAARA